MPTFFLENLPQPLGFVLIVSGLWAIVIDGRENYLRQRYRDAGFSRIGGWIYLGLGLFHTLAGSFFG